MRMFRMMAGAMALSLTLAACGQQQEESADEPTVETAAPAASPSGPKPPVAFMQCRSCHSVEPGKHGVGPSLAGVYGTKAGEIPGYAFSDALKASGITWDDAALDTWLQSPSKMVPGTKMVFFGMPDPAKRKDVIEYIKAIR